MKGATILRSEKRILTFLKACRNRTISSGENLFDFLHINSTNDYSLSGYCYLTLTCLNYKTLSNKLTKFLEVNAKWRVLCNL
jgi:hypothetical protein